MAILGIRRRHLDLAKLAASTALPASIRVRLSQRLWNRLNRKSTYGYISHLRSGEWDLDEFRKVGNRFVDRMMARYDDYVTVPAVEAVALEIGCGVGRFLRPLSERFHTVIGVDFSDEMLGSAREYCEGRTNITYRKNDGSTLTGVPDSSVDFVVSAGVFQHITALPAIMSYVREGLRVLKPGGVMLFQFEGTRTTSVGFGQIGARITAADLDEALAGAAFRIREVSRDPSDPVGNLVCVVERATVPSGDRFISHPMVERPWVGGVYDGVSTDTDMQQRQVEPAKPLTFYDR